MNRPAEPILDLARGDRIPFELIASDGRPRRDWAWPESHRLLASIERLSDDPESDDIAWRIDTGDVAWIDPRLGTLDVMAPADAGYYVISVWLEAGGFPAPSLHMLIHRRVWVIDSRLAPEPEKSKSWRDLPAMF